MCKSEAAAADKKIFDPMCSLQAKYLDKVFPLASSHSIKFCLPEDNDNHCAAPTEYHRGTPGRM